MRKTITALLMIMLIALLGCNSASDSGAESNENLNADGDDLTGDRDSSDDETPGQSTADGDESPQTDNEKSELYPPMLSDPALIPVIFGDDQSSINLDFGDLHQDSFKQDRPFEAFTFDSLAGARITISLSITEGASKPGLILYGPKAANGLWGEAKALSVGDEGEALLIDHPILAEGDYLILATTLDPGQTDTYMISLGCRNLCLEPACPDLICQPFCEAGILADPNGCPSCVCAYPECECQSDADCPEGSDCENCNCNDDGTTTPDEPEGCDCGDDYAPVCGTDGVTYPNPCWAACIGAEVAHTGECVGAIGGECNFDSDCEGSLVCMNNICVQSEGCNCPEYFDPVCSEDGLVYSNICELECAGGTLAYYGECEDVDSICMPICERLDDSEAWVDSCTGDIISFRPCTGCEVECRIGPDDVEGWYSSCGQALIVPADCMEGCDCPHTWEPVCGANGITYANQCQAECDGVSVAYSGECRGGVAGCRNDDQCPVGQQCIADDGCNLLVDEACFGTCVAQPSNATCEQQSDCPEGSTCVLQYSGGICVPSGDVDCRPTGCNLQLCEAVAVATECNWRPEYACLSFASCSLAADGQCGWQAIDDRYDSCINAIDAGQTCTIDRDCMEGWYCEQGSCMEAACICPDLPSPVCGTDGQTYANACELGCSTASLAHPGECP